MLAAWEPGRSVASSLTQTIICGLLMVPAVWLTIRWLQQGIWANEGGILVRNIFSSGRFYWSEITAFARPARYGKLWNPGLVIELTGGRRFYANLFQAGPFNRVTFADDVIGQLRELHQRYTSG